MATASNPEKQFKETKKLLQAGIEGDKKAVRSAYEKLLRIRESDPRNALVEAYYGSSLTLLARDAVKLTEKEEKALEGLGALNRAIEMDPNQKEIRMLRANVCLRLPDEYFQSLEIAIRDFSYLLDRYTTNSSYLEPKQVKDIVGKLAKAYREAGKPAQAQEMERRLAGLKK